MSSAARNISDWYLARRYALLFLSLLLTLILAPITQEFRLRSWPVELMLLINLGVASVGAGSSRTRKWALAAVILTAVLRTLGRRLNLEAASDLATILFVGLAAGAALSSLRFALKGQQVDSERLGAALSAYLLAGHAFGVCYWQVEHLRAASFAIGGTPAARGALDLPTCIYFSYVTLATLGYGDIVPLTPTARGLAVTEAIIGQLYLAVLVAGLVGSRATK